MALGSLMLFNSPDPALRVSLDVMIPAVAVISLFFVGVVALVIKAQMRKRFTGAEAMVGEEGEATTDIRGEGKALVKGEYWRAVSDANIEKGKRVKVVKIEGMKLKVEEILS